MSATSIDTHAGQAAYSPWVLRIYDAYVLGLSNRWIWKCPTKHLVAMYDRCATAMHLDVGVGSGYFLDRATFPSEPRITLFDMNANSLAFTADRIGRHAPTTVQGDVLSADAVPPGPFDSIGFNYVLHCLPGEVPGGKWRSLDHLANVLSPGGVLFGSTIVARDEPLRFAQRKLMGIYNRKGIFGNAADAQSDLESALRRRFEDVRITRHGVVALFEAREPRPAA